MSVKAQAATQEYFFERFPWNQRWVLFSLGLVVSCFDFFAIQTLLFPVLFLIPVLLLAWNCGLRTAMTLGAILCIVRISVQCAWGIPYELRFIIVNGVIRIGILFFLAWLVAKLSEQTQALRARVRTLEGMLPTCSFCKDIRDESGNWQPMETYVAQRTEARFTHGICPRCTAAQYGHILNNDSASS